MASNKLPFPKVREAREALREKALELLNEYRELARTAAARGEYEVAETILWKLIEHMPSENGERLIDASASKPKLSDGPIQPSIQIAVALGGMPQQKQLPKVIDITNEDS